MFIYKYMYNVHTYISMLEGRHSTHKWKNTNSAIYIMYTTHVHLIVHALLYPIELASIQEGVVCWHIKTSKVCRVGWNK